MHRKKILSALGMFLLLIVISFIQYTDSTLQPAAATTATTASSTPPSNTTTATTSTPQTNFYPILNVIDGDTFSIMMGDTKETIRLIGIDTPETKDPRKPVQCFGREASAKAHSILDGQNVRLEADPSQNNRDTYGRLLRYAYLPEGTLFNQLMIEEGYAHEYTYQIPYQFQRAFKEAEQSAQEHLRGLWAPDTCAGNTKKAATTK